MQRANEGDADERDEFQQSRIDIVPIGLKGRDDVLGEDQRVRRGIPYDQEQAGKDAGGEVLGLGV